MCKRDSDGGVHSVSWQQPVPHSFQVENTPTRGDNIPASPMTPIAEKSTRLLQDDEPAPRPAAFAREELTLSKPKDSSNGVSNIDASELASLLDDAVEQLGSNLGARIRDVHLELLRQHQLQQEETARMFANIQQTQLEMAAEIAELKTALENRL